MLELKLFHAYADRSKIVAILDRLTFASSVWVLSEVSSALVPGQDGHPSGIGCTQFSAASGHEDRFPPAHGERLLLVRLGDFRHDL
jgi:hypothetical protein